MRMENCRDNRSFVVPLFRCRSMLFFTHRSLTGGLISASICYRYICIRGELLPYTPGLNQAVFPPHFLDSTAIACFGRIRDALELTGRGKVVRGR
jgi:hypothetical protein